MIREPIRSFLRRATLLVALWWALGGTSGSASILGAIVIVVATRATMNGHGPSTPLRLRGLVPLAATFAVGSLRGGWDVAWRALSPRLPIDPRVIRYESDLPSDFARDMFTSLGALMPGTLAVSRDGAAIDIHLLVDRGDASRRELAALARAVSHALRAPEERP